MPSSLPEREITRQQRMDARANKLVGKRVQYRSPEGLVTGTVTDVMSRAQAEKKTGTRFSRSGRYLMIAGCRYPIHRRRCKVVER